MIKVSRETHECPQEIQERLTRAGGVNCYGEPNFRIVWSGSRLGWIGGWWTIRDEHGTETGRRFEMRQEPKWLPPWDRWILETYRPAEWFGSPWLWKLQTTEFAFPPNGGPSLPALGPYPSRGDYILVTGIDIACANCFAKSHEPGKLDSEKAMILGKCEEREFLQVSTRVADTLARMVKRNRERNWYEMKREIDEMSEIEKRATAAAEEEAIGMASEISLPKERLDRIERVIAPAIERQLAAQARRLEQMSPQQRRAVLEGKTGKATGIAYLGADRLPVMDGKRFVN